ncbi:hypothetical protein [Fodinibius saliphilus]|uniref:hypothetical protein n=1 Tax=Fodinibius saliphilus TaxID=1920650 RepID=UPI001109E25E|nr:hypothetical protein [Fodinibius saliphilus]
MLKKGSYFLLAVFLVGFIGMTSLLFFPKVIPYTLSSNLLLVSLTGAYVVLTFLILESNNELKEFQNRPYVVFSLPQEKKVIFLKIENIGKTPAYDMKIDLNPKLKTIEYDGMENSTFLKQSYLRPNEIISHPVAPISNLLEKNDKESVFDVTITYKNYKGKEFEEDYKIDTTNYVFDKRVVEFKQT